MVNPTKKRWSRSAFIGGLVQVFIVTFILFVPEPINCLLGQVECRSHNYLPYGNTSSYIFVTLVGILGFLVILTYRDTNTIRRCIIRWLAGSIMGLVALLGISGIGLAFIPGTLLILLSAIFCPNK